MRTTTIFCDASDISVFISLWTFIRFLIITYWLTSWRPPLLLPSSTSPILPLAEGLETQRRQSLLPLRTLHENFGRRAAIPSCVWENAGIRSGAGEDRVTTSVLRNWPLCLLFLTCGVVNKKSHPSWLPALPCFFLSRHVFRMCVVAFTIQLWSLRTLLVQEN